MVTLAASPACNCIALFQLLLLLRLLLLLLLLLLQLFMINCFGSSSGSLALIKCMCSGSRLSAIGLRQRTLVVVCVLKMPN